MRWTLPTAEPISRAAGADLFLYLTVDPLDELYVVTVRLVVPVLQSDREVLRIVAAPDAVPTQLERYNREIVHAVANRPVADLYILASDTDGNAVDDARLYLDGELMGLGAVATRTFRLERMNCAVSPPMAAGSAAGSPLVKEKSSASHCFFPRRNLWR